MKKTTFILVLLLSLIGWQANSQVLNQPANWPNTNWTVTGTYNTAAAAFEADPTTTANFAFDDDDAGSTSSDNIQAESPIIDLTAAFTAGETWLFVDFDYVFNWISSDSIGAEYWDADAGTWNPWGAPIQADTAGAPTDNFCSGTTEAFTSEQLNIAGFTATQLSGFKYRLFYDDGGIWGWGFCINSPTVTSQAPPTCPDITGLTATTTGDSTADISWNAGGTETEWQIWVQPAGTGVPTTDGTVTTLNAPYPATGLTPSTAYEVYVRGNCGTDGFSNWIGPVNFTTFNTPPPPPVGVTCASGASTFVFTEDFGTDTNTNPPGWTGTGFDGTNGNWDISPVSTNSGGTGPNITWDGVAGGMHLEYEASGNSTDIASAISPAIDLSTAVDGAELSFYMHAFGDDIGTLNVGVSASQTGPFTTEYAWVGDYQATADEPWIPIGINLDAYLGQVIYIEFSYGGAGTGFEGDMSIDQVSVETCGNFCVAPTGITVANITDSAADISWTANNGETAWEIVVQTAGTGVPTGPGTAITTNPYTAMGLTSSTQYEVYILADCGTGQSVWAGPVNFTTLNTPPPPPVGVTCASGTSTFIFTEDFGTDTNTDPAGWTGTGFGGGNGDWDITAESANSGGTGPNITWDGNAGMHLEYEASGNSTDIASAISPAIDLSTATDGAELSFWMHAFGDDIGTLNVGVSTSPTGPFTTEYAWIGAYQATADEAWIPIGVNLDAYLGQVIYVEFSYGGAGTGFEGDLSIDQVRVETCGNFCVAPTGIMVDAVTDTTADISWTANNGETAWEIVVQPAGTGVPTGPGTAITTNPYTAMGLTATTAYEVYILADCGSGQSVWAGPVNFTTLNTPPPAPLGVTCASGGSTFIFTEDFGTDTNTDPSGWTGTGFDGSNGNWDITAENGNSAGTGPNITWDGNPGMHLEYEASGNATDIASAISPAIDLSTAVDGAELSFWMHAFGDDIGTLNVGVSTSPTGPFTTEFTWSGDYQSTADEAWVPVGVNLDAYLGQVVYVEFSYGGAGSGFEGDLSIDQMRIEACGSFCIAPTNITLANITTNSADLSWTPSGPETQWNYAVQPVGTGTPTTWTTSSTTTVSLSGLNPATDYEVYVQAVCGTDTSVWGGPVNFSTQLQFNFTLDCAVDGPVTINYCYVNNDTNVFTFTSTDGTPLNITFNAGQVEQNWDELVVFDSDGITDLNAATPYGNNGDVSGITYQSTGGSIAFQVQSDGIFDCGSQGYIPLSVTVNCATCINQVVDFTSTTDCTNGANQFFVNADITSLGDAMSLNVTDNQGSPLQNVMTTGIVTFGPYPLNTDVILTVANADDINCVVTSSTFNVPVCPPANDECTDAIIVTPNADENCTNLTNATLYGATTSAQANVCPGTANDDVWFQFTAIATDHGIDISNVIGDTTNLNHGLYEGTDCNNLTNLYCELGNNSIANGLTVGNTYYIRIFTDADIAFQDVNFDLCVFTIPPPIIVNDTQYTVPELVTDVLVNSPCAIVSNVTWSTGTDFGTDNGIGYFEANGSNFPFQSGIVMTTGNVLDAPGPETGTQSGGGFGWPGDADLEAVINQGTTNNASIIEFDFTPLIDQLSFNFLFAAEEYGTFQCGYSDAFAFLLTDISTGVTINVALVPGTSDPVSVFTIRDDQYNSGCPSSNPQLFDFYSDVNDYPNGIGSNPIASPIDFRGRTVPLTANAVVIPNNPYHIKLVVADDGDTAFDSAVFLEASSFDIGEIDLGDDILLDSGLASCEGEAVTLDIGVPQPTGTTITWYTVDNGITEPIPGETGPTLTVSTTGLYQVDIVFTGTSAACFYSDDVLVEFFDNPTADPQNTILACDTDNSGMAIFDITENEANIVGTQTDVTVTYYETEQDAIDGTNPITNPTSYTSSGATTIYFRVENTVTGCFKVNNFNLELAPKPVVVQADDIIGCDNDNDGIAEYDLTINEAVIADGQTDLVFSYHNSIDDANTSSNAIAGTTSYDSPGAETIYVRVENATTGCFETTTFDLVFGISPETTFDSSIVYEVCPNATVPITISAEAVNYTTSEVSITWYNEGVEVVGQTGLDLPTVLTQGTYSIEVTFNDTGCSSTTDVFVSELDTCVIPQGISPNGDGINDNFDLSSYDVQLLEIYNRNGRLVYSKTNYSMEWEGQSNDGEMLPVGTYYYVMKYQGTKTKAAWVYINR